MRLESPREMQNNISLTSLSISLVVQMWHMLQLYYTFINNKIEKTLYFRWRCDLKFTTSGGRVWTVNLLLLVIICERSIYCFRLLYVNCKRTATTIICERSIYCWRRLYVNGKRTATTIICERSIHNCRRSYMYGF